MTFYPNQINFCVVMPKRRYKTLQAYMEGEGVNQTRLLALLKEETGVHLSQGWLSRVLRGSLRCSRMNAFALHVVTGVPMEELTRWPRYAETGSSKSVA